MEWVEEVLGKGGWVEWGMVGDVDEGSGEGSDREGGEVGEDGVVKEGMWWGGW